ncbi:hypothetical protein D3C81_1527970 [compost metagenome]
MVHRQQGDAIGAQVTIEFSVFNHRQCMGNECHLQAVLGNVLGADIAHQRPAVNQFQAGQMGKKVALAHGALFYNGK